MSKKSKGPGNCAFCGNTGVTKQHMWPDWLKSVIPREGDDHTQFLTRIDMSNPGVAMVRPDLQFKRGPAGSRKIRKVCSKCNSTWMSQLESTAKPLLTEMILGHKLVLTTSNQADLAAWVMMTSIIAEYTDPQTQAIPKSDRLQLMIKRLPNTTWRIWIGKYEGSGWKQRYRHHGWELGVKVGGAVLRSGYNTQTSTFVVGSLLLHAESSSQISPEILGPFDPHTQAALIPIWPLSQDDLIWPPSRTITDEGANAISDALFGALLENMSNRPSWRSYGV